MGEGTKLSVGGDSNIFGWRGQPHIGQPCPGIKWDRLKGTDTKGKTKEKIKVLGIYRFIKTISVRKTHLYIML